jgi:hypothetical protein
MGMIPYTILKDNPVLSNLSVGPDQCVVEIGSERGEGSTAFLYNWAHERGLQFYSVDVVPDAQQHFSDMPADFNFCLTSAGSDWCKDQLPLLQKRIKVLYLDNFDWIDPNNLQYQWLHDQIAAYAERGVVMNNENCQEEHRLQALYCLPYMDHESIVLIDDSWVDSGTPTGFNGKCGTAIPVFIAAGYKVKVDETADKYKLFLYRGIDL